jgi:hypothetical protein
VKGFIGVKWRQIYDATRFESMRKILPQVSSFGGWGYYNPTKLATQEDEFHEVSFDRSAFSPRTAGNGCTLRNTGFDRAAEYDDLTRPNSPRGAIYFAGRRWAWHRFSESACVLPGRREAETIERLRHQH